MRRSFISFDFCFEQWSFWPGKTEWIAVLFFLLAGTKVIAEPLENTQADASAESQDSANMVETVTPQEKPALTLFQSRFPEIDGKPDLSSLSQCHDVTGAVAGQIRPLSNIATSQPTSTGVAQVQMLADSLPQNSAQLTHLVGNVRIRDDHSLMRAEEIRIDHELGQLSASGGVSFESADAYFSALTLTRSQQTNDIVLDSPEFKLFANHANGAADDIRIGADQTIELNHLTFSTCPVDQQSWQFATSSMNIDTESGRGEAWNTVLKVGGLPVFYLPYLSFPVDDRRYSGLLSPTIKQSDRNGLDVAVPIYWNIAPWTDATFTPRHIEKRGEQIGVEWRILSEHSYSEFNLEWLEDDKLLQSQLDNPLPGITPAADDARRWQGSLQTKSEFNPNWSARINAHKVSDSDYFRDFGAGLESVNATRLTSEMALEYRDDVWQMNWFALTHQSLISSDDYRYLPSWTTQADYTDENGFRWQWSSEVTRFEHEDLQQTVGGRAMIEPAISYPMNASWGFLTPKLSYQVSQFEQTNQLTDSSVRISRQLPILSIDSGIYLDRNVTFDKKEYVHSLIPRIFYTYIPFEDQSSINNFDTSENEFNFDQLWRENRFSGVDRIGDANQISVSLANRFVEQESGDELLSFQLGRIFYFDDRQVQISTQNALTERQSPWLGQVDFRFSSSLSMTSLIEWEEKEQRTNRAETRINFEPKDNHIVNLSHRYRDLVGQRIEEMDISFAWSLNERWRMLGRWYNDVRKSQTIEAMAGIEYESCCWALRLVAQRYLNTQLDSLGQPIFVDDNYSDGVYFQFVFKGLGSAGQSGLNKLLASSIAGYRDPFANTSGQ